MGSPARRRCLHILASAVLAVSLISPHTSAQTNCTDHTFSGGRTYAACSALKELGASVHWTYHAANGTADVAFRVPGGTAGWAGWAINPSAAGMLGANTVFAYHETATGAVRVLTAVVDSYAPAVADGDLTFAVHGRGAEYADGVYDVHATVSLPGNSTRQNIVWQAGTSSPDGLPESHHAFGDNVMSSRSWDFSSGAAAAVVDANDVPAPRDSVYRVLLQPKNIHGVLNAVSWGALLPLGVILARYMRVFPSLDPAWFYLHVACQCSGYVIGAAGWVIGITLGNAKGALKHPGHRNMGTALFVLSTLQVSALLIRPKKTVKIRFYWNLYHWSVGYTVVVMGVFNVFNGIGILQPDQKYKHAYIGVVLVLVVVAFVLEVVTLTVRLKKGRR